MTYLTATPCSYNPNKMEYEINLAQFAQDIAKQLNGTVQPANDHPRYQQAIKVGNDLLRLYVQGYNSKKRVTVSINAPDIKNGDWSSYDKAQRTEDATVNPDGRSIAAIAKDIKKRVIDANQAALAARRAHAAQQVQNRKAIVKHAEALKKAYPSLRVNVDEGSQRAAIYGGAENDYISGTMHSDGTVTVDRLNSISAEKFKKLVALLNSK